ncbi:MAG TPA: hypothetical protein VMX97_02930 [Hyphomicrobiaceae bacterium]|nr:hypothetical protein [Hyphomicrobiaceae bacterium]
MKFLGRSYAFAWACLLIGAAGLACEKLTGAEYVTLVSILTALVAGRSVAQDKFGNSKSE